MDSGSTKLSEDVDNEHFCYKIIILYDFLCSYGTGSNGVPNNNLTMIFMDNLLELL